jgi:hypothetical protein
MFRRFICSSAARRLQFLALITAHSLMFSASHAEEINLLCSGTYYFHKVGELPERADTDSITVKLDDVKETIHIAGTLHANASGPMKIEEGHYWAVLPHSNEAKGVHYPYIGVNVNRMTGETLIFALSKPSFEGSGPAYFNGKCARSKRLF